jgi:CubicO group peptidase (beta-lactamase class C family)
MRTPLLLAAILIATPLAAQPKPPSFAVADSLIQDAIDRNVIPGAVLVVSQNGKVLHERAFGFAELYDFNGRRLEKPRPMQRSTLFDLASVTKVMATTMGIMLLVDRGKVDVDKPVYTYLPEFRGPHLDSITVRHLLQHSGGLVQWQPIYYHAKNKTEAYKVIREMPLQWGVGEGRHYSDLGFMLLGYLIERVTGKPLDVFMEEELYRPLGLRNTLWNAKAKGRADVAATEFGNGYEKRMVYDTTFNYKYRGDPTSWNGWRNYVLVGETDDGNSWYAHGGIAGHAGLFSTASDVRILLDLLLNGGMSNNRQFIRREVIEKFLTRDRYENFLGWMSPTGLPEGSFSHTGFTGTYVLGVPSAKVGIVLFTNKQNVGANARGVFSNNAPLDLAVARAVLANVR